MIEFKNLRLYRWDGPEGRTYWNELFLRRPFLPVGPQNETSEGWAPPFGDDEAIADVGGHWLAHWVREERILPASVVKAEAEQRAEAIAEERGYPLSRKELRDLREGKGLALEVLARTVGISPSYLGMIETGERLPDLAIRRSLAWELGVAGWREAS